MKSPSAKLKFIPVKAVSPILVPNHQDVINMSSNPNGISRNSHEDLEICDYQISVVKVKAVRSRIVRTRR